MKPTVVSVCALIAGALSLSGHAALAQTTSAEPAVPADSIAATGVDDEGVALGLQFGIATGALHYPGGRSEQSLGAVIRWAPTRWLNVSTTPTAIRATAPAVAPSSASLAQSGLVDLPLEATATHVIHVRFEPSFSVGLGVTLPIGDTATGFGTGKLGYSTSASVGLAPTDQLWVHVGAGRSLSGLSVQSAFTGANGWADLSAGYSLTERFSVNTGYSTDLGPVDPTIGRSTSVSGGLAVALRGPLTFNATTSHGVSGAAPRWSIAMGIGTAFPYLRHLDAGSPSDLLRNAFGGGTHGLSGPGISGGSSSSGRGRRP